MTAEEDFQRRVEALLKKQARDVEELGFSAVGVFGGREGPGFTYSIGLGEIGAPELVIWGLPHEIGHAFIGMYYEKAKGGWRPKDWERCSDFATDYDCVFRRVDPEVAKDTATMSILHAEAAGRDNFELFAMVWPDTAGKFPWEEGFNEKYRRAQPDVWTKSS